MKIKIKEARQRFEELHGYKLTMERLAELTMWDSKGSLLSKMDTLNRMQRGEMSHPSITLIDRIATICGVTIDFLIDREEYVSKREYHSSK